MLKGTAMNTHPPRFTRQRIDSPHVITFCAEMGAVLLAARARQRNPQRGAARAARATRATTRDATQQLQADIAELQQAVKTYAELILAPEIALSGEPQTTGATGHASMLRATARMA